MRLSGAQLIVNRIVYSPRQFIHQSEEILAATWGTCNVFNARTYVPPVVWWRLNSLCNLGDAIPIEGRRV